MKLLIKNTRMVDEKLDFIGDLYIEDGKIIQYGVDLNYDCETIDGRYKISFVISRMSYNHTVGVFLFQLNQYGVSIRNLLRFGILQLYLNRQVNVIRNTELPFHHQNKHRTIPVYLFRKVLLF